MNTQTFSQTGQLIELCCKYLSVRCIWLYVLIMSRTYFRVNAHSIVAWMSRKTLLKSGAISETKWLQWDSRGLLLYPINKKNITIKSNHIEGLLQLAENIINKPKDRDKIVCFIKNSCVVFLNFVCFYWQFCFLWKRDKDVVFTFYAVLGLS